MKLTKCFALILSVLMLFGMMACGTETVEAEAPVAEAEVTEGTVEETPAEEAEAEVVAEMVEDEVADVRFENVEQIGCWFVKSVHALDGEFIGSGYEEREGKVFVDLVLYVINDTEKDFGDDCIAGSLVYEGVSRDMQFARESDHLAAMESDPIGAGEVGYVHLFTLLPEEAMNEEVTVTYTLNGEEYTCVAEVKPEQDPLEAKTQLQVGDVRSACNGVIEFEVLEAKIVENLQASNQTDSYYAGPFVLVKLEMTNNHPDTTIDHLFSYVVIDEAYCRISPDVEADAGDRFTSLGADGIEPGETKTLFLYVDAEEGMGAEDMIFRFNLGESCYYVSVAE